jgi:hypothetical protein
MSWPEFVGGLIIGLALGFGTAFWFLNSGEQDWSGDQ